MRRFKQCHTFKNATSQSNVTNVENRLVQHLCGFRVSVVHSGHPPEEHRRGGEGRREGMGIMPR